MTEFQAPYFPPPFSSQVGVSGMGVPSSQDMFGSGVQHLTPTSDPYQVPTLHNFQASQARRIQDLQEQQYAVSFKRITVIGQKLVALKTLY